MAKVKNRDNSKVIYCPGCDREHVLDERWEYNGDPEAPTFKPSLVYEGGRYRDGNWEKLRCHSYITAGKIRFLPDSSHSLAGQTKELPDHEEIQSDIS